MAKTARKLLLICAVVILYLPITNGECREVPSQCEWDDEHHYSVCIITKTPSNDIIRRLQLSNYITDRNIDHIHVSVPTEMEDHIDVFWNEEYLMLSFLEGQLSGEYTLVLTTISYRHIPHYSSYVQKTIPAPIIIRSFDVPITNVTPVANNQEVVLECSVTGLYLEEKDVEIRFNDKHEYMCEGDWPSSRQQTANLDDPYPISTNNGTTCQLHIPNATTSYSGDYYCRVKIHVHTNKPTANCMFLKSQTMTITIPEESSGDTHMNTGTSPFKIGIAVGVPAFILLILSHVLTAFLVYKLRKPHQNNQQEEGQRQQNQPPPQVAHQQNQLPPQVAHQQNQPPPQVANQQNQPPPQVANQQNQPPTQVANQSQQQRENQQALSPPAPGKPPQGRNKTRKTSGQRSSSRQRQQAQHLQSSESNDERQPLLQKQITQYSGVEEGDHPSSTSDSSRSERGSSSQIQSSSEHKGDSSGEGEKPTSSSGSEVSPMSANILPPDPN